MQEVANRSMRGTVQVRNDILRAYIRGMTQVRVIGMHKRHCVSEERLYCMFYNFIRNLCKS